MRPGVPERALPRQRSGFIALDPWIRPPEARLLALAPRPFWRDHRLLPVQLDGQGLVVAASDSVSDAVVGSLRALIAQPISLVSAAQDEITFWLDVLEGGRTWSEALADSLAALLRELGLHAVPDAPFSGLFASPDALEVSGVAEAFGLTEDVAVEVLALRARLPQIRLERYHPGPALATLLPQAEAGRMAVVPVAVHAGFAILATPRVLARGVVDELQHLVGLRLQLAVCAPSAFSRAFTMVFGGAARFADAASQPVAATIRVAEPAHRAGDWTDDTAVLRQLMAAGRLDDALGEGLLGVAHVQGESPVHAGVRLGYLDSSDVERARAAALGLAPLALDQPRVDARLAALGAPDLWRRWRCVPTGHSGRRAILACDAPPEPDRLEAIRQLLGVGSVQPRYLLPEQLTLLLGDLPSARTAPYTATDHLVFSGLVAPSDLRAAQQRVERDGTELVAELLGSGAITTEDVVEARSIAFGRPWVRLARYAPQPGVAQLVPEELARAEHGLTLRRHGQSLTFALFNGNDQPRPGVLERSTGLAIDLLQAAVSDPEEAFSRWYGHAQVELPEHVQAFGQFLVRGGLLSRAQLDGVWDRQASGGLSLDEALAGRSLLTPEEVAQAFADHLALPLADLEPRRRDVPFVDALGDTRLHVTWVDPVDAPTARLLSSDLAQEHAAIPIRSPGGTRGAIEVAFANPLDATSIAAVAAALGRHLRTFVATRRAVELAQRRAYGRKSLGERLLEAGLITGEQLGRALRVHDQTGVRLGQVLVNLGFIHEEELAATLADQAALPFVDLRGTEIEATTARLLPREIARARGILPLYADGDEMVVGCADPRAFSAADAAELLGRPVRLVLVTESALDRALDLLYRDEYLEQSAADLVHRTPDDSARWVLSRGQKIFFAVIAGVIGLGLVLAPMATLTVLVSLSTLFYVAFAGYKFYLAYRAFTHRLEVETTSEELAGIDERELPVYTILVPVYHEAAVFPLLTAAIERLDYPKAKLDVKILLEEDDSDTIAVAQRSALPSHFKLLLVPSGTPRGKPKACNYGLIHAQGEYVVIFDAEDIPEPDQLKKALVVFQKSSPRLACVQAKLNYFNRDQNLLTRWFTTEYSMWFDLFLPGLDASNAPIPLGGTSNHFRTARLRELGAWDPHNVTEDADLGIRLYKAGWKTAVIDSTTYEEANSDLYNWIRQRSRWVKGYMQTYLVHMRHPIRLWRAIGPRAFCSFQLVVGGTFFGFLINPIFWILTALWFSTHWGVIKQLFPPAIFYLGALGLYLGNFTFTYLNVAGCLKRGYYDMVKYALLSPIYWALMSVAAWKGFLQLFYAPSYWEKTNHGLFRAGPGSLPTELTAAPSLARPPR